MTNEPLTLEKLKMYKTAYSPVWEKYVEIKRVFADVNGIPVIVARVPNISEQFYFREIELNQFCL